MFADLYVDTFSCPPPSKRAETSPPLPALPSLLTIFKPNLSCYHMWPYSLLSFRPCEARVSDCVLILQLCNKSGESQQKKGKHDAQKAQLFFQNDNIPFVKNHLWTLVADDMLKIINVLSPPTPVVTPVMQKFQSKVCIIPTNKAAPISSSCSVPTCTQAKQDVIWL